MKATFKLLNSYYLKGFFGPFFVVIFPMLLLFILGNSMDSVAKSSPIDGVINPNAFMRNVVGGIMITALISNGLFGLPIMIIEFKKSTLIKRIGAAHISKTQFFTAVILYQLLWSLFSVIWVLLWGGIIIGTKADYDWSVAFSLNLLESTPFILLALMVSMGIGLLIVSLVNTQQAVMGITNVIYLPISFLSGSFTPKSTIDASPLLNGVSYLLPTKYAVDPFFATFQKGYAGLRDMGWEGYGFPLIAIALIAFFIVVTIKKFKWST